MPKPEIHSSLHGWLILDKPLGLTSTQALGRARRLLGGKKAGHGGTLDPLATGVLPLAFGEATKLIPYVLEGDKEYEFTVRWGESRSTDDAEGEVVEKSPLRPTEPQLREVLPNFIGIIQQKPPAFSAIKIHGERAYALARAGAPVDLAPREVRIKELELVECVDENSASFRVSCGKGFYVRALARDMATHLGTRGYVSAIRRLKSGPFVLENAVSMAELERLSIENAASTLLLPLKSSLGSIPTLSLTQNESESLHLGKTIILNPNNKPLFNASPIFAEYNGMPVALVEAVDGVIRVLRGFRF